jgi:Na+/proline symporter
VLAWSGRLLQREALPVHRAFALWTGLLAALPALALGAFRVRRDLYHELLVWKSAKGLLVLLGCAAAAALLFALNSKSTMYEMVQNAYKVTLVSCIVPLAAGIWWSRATVQGALASATGGIVVWLACEGGLAEQFGVPAQLVGLAASLLLMVVGSLAPQLYTERRPHAAHELTDRAPLAR